MLDRTAQWLSNDPYCPTLLFLHHPPVIVHSRWIDNIRLQNADALRQIVLNSPGVSGVFSGHIHQEFEGSFGQMPFFSAPSTAFQFAPRTDSTQFDLLPPGFRVIELTGRNVQTHVVRLDNLLFTPQDD